MSEGTYWQKDSPLFCANDGTCYTAKQQERIRAEACASWYIALIFCQFFHVWVCKTRRASIFRHGVMNNAATVYGTMVELCLLVILVYVPGVQDVMGAAPVDYVPWLIGAGSGVLTWIYSESIKYYARRQPHGHKTGFVRFLAW